MDYTPKGGLFGKINHLSQTLTDYHIPTYASSTCYFIVLSVFPALVLLLGMLRFTNLDVENLLEMLDGVIPDVLMGAAGKLIRSTFYGSSTALVSLSAVMTLWSASRGVFALVTGLDAIYGHPKKRSAIFSRLISVVYTVLFMLLLLLTLLLHVFGTTIANLLPHNAGGLFGVVLSIIDLRFFVLLFLQTLLFTAMYKFLPTRKTTLRQSLPGALLSSIGWLVFSDIFSIYVENFNRYTIIYGSVYTVALAMLWLYFCITILFYGGALNCFLMERSG